MNGQRRSIHDEQSILFYTNTNLPLCDGYHLPGCHNCSDCRWKSLVFCSGCPAAFHSECLGKYGMKPPSGYVDMTSQSNRPHPGCGDLWLCPLCCEKLVSTILCQTSLLITWCASRSAVHLLCDKQNADNVPQPIIVCITAVPDAILSS